MSGRGRRAGRGCLGRIDVHRCDSGQFEAASTSQVSYKVQGQGRNMRRRIEEEKGMMDVGPYHGLLPVSDGSEAHSLTS